MGSGSVIEVAGPAAEALARAAELRREGWSVFVRSTRLDASCDIVWCLELERKAAG
ncbi:MAG: hypothetical protein QOJ79_572 [Actinomycetota bacterium]|jgi:hypothetical protein|nr:hypothetical protein [Actinomycetota bacterium]